jgi:putative oxidoreductase
MTTSTKKIIMKIATIIARCLLGLVFVVFGANKFLHFLPNPPMQGPGAQFMGVLFETHYIYVVATCEVVGGLLLLTGRYLPLGLTLVGPVVVNILSFHIFMDNSGLPVALVVSALALFLLWRHREHFAGLVKPVQSARREAADVGSPAQAAATGSAKN